MGSLVDLRDTQSLSYSDVASTIVVTYDILLTLSDEIEYFWRPWTPAKALYLSARYLPHIGQLAVLAINTNANGTNDHRWSKSACHTWFIVQAVALQIAVTTVDMILLLRVYALYSRSRKLMFLLVPLFIAEFAILIVVIALIVPTVTFNGQCFVTSISSRITAYWTTSLVYESILFLLTLVKFFEAVHDGWGQRPVMTQFVTDGTWAFTLIFLTMLVNSFLYPLAHSPFAGICFNWLLSVLSFCGSRLLLNSRRAFSASRDVSNEMTTRGTLIELSTVHPRSFPAVRTLD